MADLAKAIANLNEKLYNKYGDHIVFNRIDLLASPTYLDEFKADIYSNRCIFSNISIINDLIDKFFNEYYHSYDNYMYKYIKSLYYLVMYNFNKMFEYVKAIFVNIKEGKNYITNDDYCEDIIDEHGYIYILIGKNYIDNSSYNGNVIIHLFQKAAKLNNPLGKYCLGCEYNRIGNIYKKKKYHETMIAYFEAAIHKYNNYDEIDTVIGYYKYINKKNELV